MSNCQHCGANTSNGLELCELGQEYALKCFEYLPVYFRNLARTRRPGRPNGTLSGGSSWLIQHGEVDGSHVAPTLGRAITMITTYATFVADTRGLELPNHDDETDTMTALCAFLEQNLNHIATQPWAGQLIHDLARHEHALRLITETTVPGWYAGTCRHITGRDMEGNTYRCQAPTYVVPGLTWVTCRNCGTTTAARDHLEAILEEARTWVARPKRIAEALVALLDSEQSVPRLYERIRKWEQREKLQPLRHTAREHAYDPAADTVVVVEVPTGYARYRLGDVLDLVLATRATTNTSENTPAAS